MLFCDIPASDSTHIILETKSTDSYWDDDAKKHDSPGVPASELEVLVHVLAHGRPSLDGRVVLHVSSA